MNLYCIALIGFGEAGSILGHDLAALGLQVQTFDRLLMQENTREPLRERARSCRVQPMDSIERAVQGAQLVISAVTAGAALEVAEAATPYLQPGQLYMDINSVAPGTKQQAQAFIENVGAGYIDAAVMAPVPPQRLKTPMLLGGQRAHELADGLTLLGFNCRVVAEQVGAASAIKMCRSVMIKGLEALTYECLATARHYGTEQEVLASLHKSFPSMGWDGALPHYLISRIAEHGRRRAEEMEEVALTAAQAGVEPRLSRAIANSQRALVDAMAKQGLAYAALSPFDWCQLADTLQPRKRS